MKFRYETSYDQIGEFSASGFKQPTLADYSRANRFLAGTGVRFQVGPLSAREGCIVVALLDAYLSKQKAQVLPNVIARYTSCDEGVYTYYHGSDVHQFSLNNATMKLIEQKPFSWRDKILIADNIYDAELYSRFQSSYRDNQSAYIEKAVTRLCEFAENVFHFKSTFTAVQVRINLSDESFAEIKSSK
tara:strand:+ start:109992 stop:110555 length:564 start_codon:yes stop_codon:yes gene_type:complete